MREGINKKSNIPQFFVRWNLHWLFFFSFLFGIESLKVTCEGNQQTRVWVWDYKEYVNTWIIQFLDSEYKTTTFVHGNDSLRPGCYSRDREATSPSNTCRMYLLYVKTCKIRHEKPNQALRGQLVKRDRLGTGLSTSFTLTSPNLPKYQK